LKVRFNKIGKKHYFASLLQLTMVNILVPTDFSDLSKVAIKFAIKVANKLNGNITLLHIVNMMQPTRDNMRLKIKSMEQELIDVAKEDFEELVKETSKQNKTNRPIKYKVARGTSFSRTLKRQAKKLHSGLIVMGTRGSSDFKKVIMGDSTAAIIDVSHIPVLAVPELAEFKSFKNIVYATDLKHLENELKALLPYANIFGSTVHIVHVTPAEKNVRAAEEKIYKSALGRIDYKKFVVKVIVSKKVDNAIEDYVTQFKADMVTTFAHEHSFYEKLFNRNIAQKLAFQSNVPLLAFKQQ
jgi:nucleotide-binding universal stress UspA family protein